MPMTDDKPVDEALDTTSVAPPKIREAHDADDHDSLKADPGHEDAKLDIGLDETFPSSDPPAAATRGHADPAPSSGYDEEAERKLAEKKG